jgi:hypothetical protein
MIMPTVVRALASGFTHRTACSQLSSLPFLVQSVLQAVAMTDVYSVINPPHATPNPTLNTDVARPQLELATPFEGLNILRH